MQRRYITPYPSAPDLSAYEDISLDSTSSCKISFEQEHSCKYVCHSSLWCETGPGHTVQWRDLALIFFFFSDGLLKKTKVKAKKKPRRRSDSSGGYNLSDIIQSSPTDAIQSPPSVGEPAYSN